MRLFVVRVFLLGWLVLSQAAWPIHAQESMPTDTSEQPDSTMQPTDTETPVPTDTPVEPNSTPTPNIACPTPTSFGGKASNSVDCAVESNAPPPRPCTTRQKISPPSEPAAPQKNEAATNRMIEPVRYRFRPK